MLSSPLDYASSLRIGTVIFVSPDEVKVQLEIDSPDSVALNTTTPRGFPRINSYLLVPCDSGYLVGQVQWITIENSEYPKRKGLRDFGLIDLPFPMRKLSLAPLGCLQKKDTGFVFYRGIEAFPSVGDTVLLPTDDQLHAIVTSGKNLRVKIGTSPLAGNADVMIDPDRLFGRHLAVLGNTGSGKSCSVAGLIRWSLDEVQNEFRKKGEQKTCNARFIILDPNGEYHHSFQDLHAKLFSASTGSSKTQLKIPLWFFNSEEWCALTRATDKTQKPTLIQALRNVRSGDVDAIMTPSHDMRNFLRTLISIVRYDIKTGAPWAGFPKSKSFVERIHLWESGGLKDNDLFSHNERTILNDLRQYISKLVTPRLAPYAQTDIAKEDVDTLLFKLQKAHIAFGGSDNDILPVDADIPLPFSGESFLRAIEANAELLNVSEHVETLLMRIKTIMSDIKLRSVIDDETQLTLESWLETYIGNSQTTQITVVDLSLIPTEIIHIVTAIIARMTFESLQRYRRLEHKVFPTVLVIEEAHSFIKRYGDEGEYQDSSSMCCKVFERIAREGRKFGLGLVLSSQRPSELSPTVLSQCNTFLLHRISNDKDQELVHRLLPDNLHGILRDLPILPSRNAILLGWASELPVLVRMNELPQSQRPQSDDPDFWEVWTRNVERTVNWETIADDWQNKSHPEQQIPPRPDSTADSQNEEEDNSFTPMDSWYDEQNPNR